MRSTRVIWLAAGTLAVLLLVIFFFRENSRSHSVIIEDDVLAVATTSERQPTTMPSVSPDGLTGQLAGPAASAGIQARAAAMMDLTNGVVLYGFQADARWPIASMTKLMTAEIVLEKMDGEALIDLTPADFSFGGGNLTSSLQPGDRYKVSDLMKILLVSSSNEAADAFARVYGRNSFMVAMNSRASDWELTNTHFADPSGVSAANQSTPGEFLELMRRIHTSHPEIFEITRSRFVTVSELRTGVIKQFLTTNNFAGRPDFLGGKTGTTPEAGGNLASIFQIAGRPVAIVVFGSNDRYAATDSLLQLIR